MPITSDARFPVTVYPPAPPTDRPLVVIFPGMGMGARYFRPIAEALAQAGFSVAAGEIMGQGESPLVAKRGTQWGYHDQAAENFPATIRKAKEELGLHPAHPTVLLCHSMGGQIGALFMARPEAEELNVIGMFGVGAGIPWGKAFPMPFRAKWSFGIQTMALFSRIAGFWPGDKVKLGGYYGRHPRTFLVEWALMNRTGQRGKLTGQDINYVPAMLDTQTPVLLTRFTNDQDCPRRSAQALADELGNATVEELPGELGHNRWAREPEVVVKRMIEFADSL